MHKSLTHSSVARGRGQRAPSSAKKIAKNGVKRGKSGEEKNRENREGFFFFFFYFAPPDREGWLRHCRHRWGGGRRSDEWKRTRRRWTFKFDGCYSWSWGTHLILYILNQSKDSLVKRVHILKCCLSFPLLSAILYSVFLLITFLGNPLLSQILKICLVSQTSQNMTIVLIYSFYAWNFIFIDANFSKPTTILLHF